MHGRSGFSQVLLCTSLAGSFVALFKTLMALPRAAAGVATLTLAQHEGHQVMFLDKQMKRLELHVSTLVYSAGAKAFWGS